MLGSFNSVGNLFSEPEVKETTSNARKGGEVSASKFQFRKINKKLGFTARSVGSKPIKIDPLLSPSHARMSAVLLRFSPIKKMKMKLFRLEIRSLSRFFASFFVPTLFPVFWVLRPSNFPHLA